MLFSDLARTFDRLESTTKRLEMTTILADFLRTADHDSLRDIAYLAQGKLHPDFHPQVLGMSDRLILKAVSKSSGYQEDVVERMWIESGDTGTVAEKLMDGKGVVKGGSKQTSLDSLFEKPAPRKRQMNFEDMGIMESESSGLDVSEVMGGLRRIESTDGKRSQEGKINELMSLLKRATPVEARYICRIATGRMRVGAGDMTFLDALGEAFATKEDRPDIERAFNITCDMGLVAETIAKGGMDAIRAVSVSVGNPVKVMLAERLPSIPELVEKFEGRCAMEFKYDGIRIQAHISRDSVKLYSRRLEDLTPNFPDVARFLRSRCRHDEAIVEGECVAIDPETGFMLPFQHVTHRRKKHGIDDAVRDIPVRMFMFDMIYADGEDMTMRPYLERRRALEEGFDLGGMIQMTTMRVVESEEEGEEFFANAVTARCEGIMAKSVASNSIYKAGNRGFLWIKYKKDYQQALTDSFDLVVVGAFYGMGKRAGKYGALLMAAYDPEKGMFETVCKLGTGFDDAFLEYMPTLLNGNLSKEMPRSVDAEMIPDVWFEPTVVMEVVAAEITLSPIHTASKDVYKDGAGLGLRFPRYTGRLRSDKDPEQCTTVTEIGDMYERQAHDSDGLSETGDEE